MTTLSVPPQYGLIGKYEIRRREEMYAILIKISNKVLNEFPLISLMDFTIISYICLMTPSDMPPQNIETVTIHSGLAK